MQVSIIYKHQINDTNKSTYEKLIEVFGSEPERYPFIVFIEPNIDTMRFN